ncbi:MAG: 3-methyl-2-oxobutanoate hydroxymethyltransferase [Bdellovibrionaceae bacterium]|nr:3-methyl-2-oxobutanoate hydroxymethyltransferase [Pseudobdellovibrionaceae bacterium]
MKTVPEFGKKKLAQEKISMITCYDFWSAKIINTSPIDCILVGDSVGMVMHGFDSTIPVDIHMMETHLKAVRKGAPDKLIIADMPFLAHRKGTKYTMDCVERLMRAGANAVKIEAQPGHDKIIKHIVDSGVPVVGHIGLIPQSVNQLGGYKIQGKDNSSALRLHALAKKLEESGCCAIVLECIPENLAKRITDQLHIPTIGIGSGTDTDGQVLVLHDLLGCQNDFSPKFVTKMANVHSIVAGALSDFHDHVQNPETLENRDKLQ